MVKLTLIVAQPMVKQYRLARAFNRYRDCKHNQVQIERGYNMTTRCALTTFDNPYDPFTQFDSWFLFDVEKGYNSCAYLARIAKTSEQLTDDENNAEIERAIDEIIFNDFMNIYKKVKEETKTNSSVDKQMN